MATQRLQRRKLGLPWAGSQSREVVLSGPEGLSRWSRYMKDAELLAETLHESDREEEKCTAPSSCHSLTSHDDLPVPTQPNSPVHRLQETQPAMIQTLCGAEQSRRRARKRSEPRTSSASNLHGATVSSFLEAHLP